MYVFRWIHSAQIIYDYSHIGTVLLPLVTTTAINGTGTVRLTYHYILIKQGFLYPPLGRACSRTQRKGYFGTSKGI